jgi:hypothetical protein
MSLGNIPEPGNQESAKEVKFATFAFLSCKLAIHITEGESVRLFERLEYSRKELLKIKSDIIPVLKSLKDDPQIAEVFLDSESVCESDDPLIKIIEIFEMMLYKFEYIINSLLINKFNLSLLFHYKNILSSELYTVLLFHRNASEKQKQLCLPLFQAIGMENPEAYYEFNPNGYLLKNILDKVTDIQFSFEM